MPDSESYPSMRIPDGSVVITPTQMYQEIRETHDLVKDVAAKLDPALTEIRNDIADHEGRIRGIERRVWFWAGTASALGASAGYFLSRVSGL
jgi:hypothetical protein